MASTFDNIEIRLSLKRKLLNAALNFSVLTREGAVTGHAGENFFVRIYFADVPQTRHQHSAFGFRSHLLNCLGIVWRSEDDVDGHLPHFVWKSKAVACRGNWAYSLGEFDFFIFSAVPRA